MQSFVQDETGIHYTMGDSTAGFVAWEDLDRFLLQMKEQKEVHLRLEKETQKMRGPLFLMDKSFNPQLYVDDMIHLTSIDHVCDIVRDSRFWIIERWLRNPKLAHYQVSEFYDTLCKFLRPWLEKEQT